MIQPRMASRFLLPPLVGGLKGVVPRRPWLAGRMLVALALTGVFLAGSANSEEATPPPAPAPEPKVEAPPPEVPESPSPDRQQTHTVTGGDTLWDLARRYLSSPWRWNELWNANRESVQNPHWIYPGQTLRIPPIRVEVVSQPAPPAPPPPAPVAVAAAPPPEVPFVPPPEAPPEMPVMKLVPPTPSAIPTVRVSPSLDKPREFVYSGLLGTGFISEQEYEDAPKVVGTLDGRRLMGQGDVVYLEFEEAPTVQKGAKYLIVRVGEELEHPETGDNLGYRIEVLGSAEIEDISTESAAARVMVSYDFISAGDLVIPMQEVPDKVFVKKGKKGIEGYIVAAREQSSFLGQGDIVYVDLGTSNGSEAGQLFQIVRTEEEVGGLVIPPVVVGELVVLRLGTTTSTAVITKSSTTLQVGDKLRSE